MSGPHSPSNSADAPTFESVYRDYSDLLVEIAVTKFQIPAHDAEALVNDVFMAYFRRSSEVRDVRPYLIGAICHLSRHYWRLQSRTIAATDLELDRVDPASLTIIDSLPDQLAAREALSALPARYRQVLQLRYLEGLTISEIAERLGITPKYAKALVRKCLRAAEKLYAEKGLPRGEKKSREDNSVRDTIEGFVDAYRKLG